MKLASTLTLLQPYEYIQEKQKSLQVNITTGPGRIGHNDACPSQPIWRLAFQPEGRGHSGD